ncbi:phosphate ABC transporter membrane protein 1 (PhoT family) [Bacillus oleivorans]|uniref:Phosphate transport system permease protein n=1 Tax=Bacillus oleivorans TaxID=1448271 RepID=A0A285CK01_9BACI|nr:phosphate ABC transporter membrane protein 1 (PhoT family) [Bacillus oleivorans]
MEKTKQSSIQQMIVENKSKRNTSTTIEKAVPWILLVIASVSVLTTIGIVLTLVFETITFFTKTSFWAFLTGTEWYPFSNEESYGVLALVSGTLKIAIIAMIVAVPIGLGAAIYLSEYASDRARRIIKPILEVLAGVPTIVYGFFALTFVTPLLREYIPNMEIFNALSPGIVVGIMIIPMIASLSEDAMGSVPKSIREGAYAMGATRFEVALKIVFPAALSGIIASIVLAVSRAIGETMIVSIGAGSTPTFDWNILGSIQTMTGYIVQISTGDAGLGSTIYYSIFAVGFTLFVFTLVMNMLAQYISRRFREEY